MSVPNTHTHTLSLSSIISLTLNGSTQHLTLSLLTSSQHSVGTHQLRGNEKNTIFKVPVALPTPRSSPEDELEDCPAHPGKTVLRFLFIRL